MVVTTSHISLTLTSFPGNYSDKSALYKSNGIDSSEQGLQRSRSVIMSGLGKLTVDEAEIIGVALEGFFYGKIYVLR